MYRQIPMPRRSEGSKKSSSRVLQVRGALRFTCPASQPEEEKAHYFVETVDSDTYFKFVRENHSIENFIAIYSTYQLNIHYQLMVLIGPIVYEYNRFSCST